MTEAEWLVSEDPARMLDFVRGNRDHRDRAQYKFPVSDRKLRLWVEACRETTGIQYFEFNLMTSDGVREAVNAWAGSGRTNELPWSARANLLREIIGNPWCPIELERVIRCERCGGLRSRAEQFICADRSCNGLMQDKYPWLTPTVLSLAEAAYEERARVWKGRKHDHDEETGWQDADHLDPDRLGVLADALEDAGAEEEIVRHLRGEERIMTCKRCGKTDTINCHCNTPKWITKRSPCVRGCHVIDAILGKE